jgi:hypothetical protein
MNAPKPPTELDAIADVVLAYRPKPKTKPGKKRKRRAAKLARLTKSSPEPRLLK